MSNCIVPDPLMKTLCIHCIYVYTLKGKERKVTFVKTVFDICKTSFDTEHECSVQRGIYRASGILCVLILLILLFILCMFVIGCHSQYCIGVGKYSLY